MASSCDEWTNVNVIFFFYAMNIFSAAQFYSVLLSFWQVQSPSALRQRNSQFWAGVEEQKGGDSGKEVNKLALVRPKKQNKNIIHLLFSSNPLLLMP